MSPRGRGVWFGVASVLFIVVSGCAQPSPADKVRADWEANGLKESLALADLEWAAWKAHHLPTTLDEVPASIPVEEDGGVEWRAALKLLSERSGQLGNSYQFADVGNWDNGSVPALLKKNKDVVDLLKIAASKPQMSFRPHSSSSEIDYGAQQSATLLLTMEAVAKIREGRWPEGIEALRTSYKLDHRRHQLALQYGRHESPTNFLETIKAICACASMLQDNPEALEQLSQFTSQPIAHWERALAARYQAFQAFAYFNSRSDEELIGEALDPVKRTAYPRRELDGRLTDEPMARAAAIEAMSFWNAIYPLYLDPDQTEEQLISAFKDRKKVFSSSGSAPQAAVADRVLHPAPPGPENPSALAQAELMGRVYLVVLRFRHQKGRLPKSLIEAGVGQIDGMTYSPDGKEFSLVLEGLGRFSHPYNYFHVSNARDRGLKTPAAQSMPNSSR